MTTIDWSALVEDVVDGYRPTIEDAGRPLRVTIATRVTVTGNRQLLAQMLANLLDNALRHSDAGTFIEVNLSAADGDVRLSVADGGPGIASDQREFVLGRFARLESSRSTPGHGLGLSLVAAVARVHGGGVRIEDNDPGALLVVTLPETTA